MYMSGERLYTQGQYVQALNVFQECASMVGGGDGSGASARNTEHYIEQCRTAMDRAELEQLESAKRARLSEKDAKLAQKLGQLQPFLAVFP
jgi:hypothetical protein